MVLLENKVRNAAEIDSLSTRPILRFQFIAKCPEKGKDISPRIFVENTMHQQLEAHHARFPSNS